MDDLRPTRSESSSTKPILENKNQTTVIASPHRSLEGMHSTVAVPHHEAGFWQQWRAFIGPAILVSVGYMDPGNWGTDLAGGARFKYGL
jgi:manganese transport protein